MLDTSCQYQVDHHTRIKRLEELTDNLDDRVSAIDKNTGIIIERISISLENLSRLPEAIDALRETNNKMEVKIDNVGAEVNNLRTEVGKEVNFIKGRLANVENNVRSIDEDGKINFRIWLSKNAFKIVLFVSVGSIFLGFWIEEIMKKVIK